MKCINQWPERGEWHGKNTETRTSCLLTHKGSNP